MNQFDQTDKPPSATLMRLVNGYQVSQAIHVAATLGITDLFQEWPQSAAARFPLVGTVAMRTGVSIIEGSPV